MAGVFEAIGVISGVLGIIQFGADNFATPKSVASTVRIAVGLDFSGGLDNAGGDLPEVRLFNEAGDFIGKETRPGSVGSGGFADIEIDQKGNTQQATYALFTAGENAVCIAYTAITWPSGDQYSWIGDWGRQCGGSWYYSNYFISGSNRKPDCMWIDSNNDQPQTGFQVHWPEFSKQESGFPEDAAGQAERIDYLCNAGPPFKMHAFPNSKPNALTHWVLGTDRAEDKTFELRRGVATATSYAPPSRAVSARFQQQQQPRDNSNNSTSTASPQFNNLVVDDSDDRTGAALCESPTSVGPDFVNTADGTFCRMSDKTLFPVCGGEVADNCFNIDAYQLVVGGVAARGGAPYDNILDWTSKASRRA